MSDVEAGEPKRSSESSNVGDEPKPAEDPKPVAEEPKPEVQQI